MVVRKILVVFPKVKHTFNSASTSTSEVGNLILYGLDYNENHRKLRSTSEAVKLTNSNAEPRNPEWGSCLHYYIYEIILLLKRGGIFLPWESLQNHVFTSHTNHKTKCEQNQPHANIKNTFGG